MTQEFAKVYQYCIKHRYRERRAIETMDRIGKGQKEENSHIRKITRHSFRRFVKSTIAD